MLGGFSPARSVLAIAVVATVGHRCYVFFHVLNKQEAGSPYVFIPFWVELHFADKVFAIVWSTAHFVDDYANRSVVWVFVAVFIPQRHTLRL